MGKVSGSLMALVLAVNLVSAGPARADIYQAAAAVEKNDLPRAFELYREIAELGYPAAQEIVAGMYVNGEGVKRDNVLGYAWAKLALENGGGEIARSIVSQLEPRLNERARERVAAIHAEFGPEALARRILPVAKSAGASPDTACRMEAPANPDAFFPFEQKRKGVSGSAIVEAPVRADGSSRTPRALYSYPVGAFDEAGRAVALASRYWAEKRDGRARRCSVVFKVNFRMADDDFSKVTAKTERIVADLRARAVAGDPLSQMSYGALIGLWPVFANETENYWQWFLKAAQAGVPAAQFMIGAQVMGGSIFEADRAKGEFWLEQGAKGGSGAAQAALASYLLVKEADAATRDRGFEWMRRSSETSHREGKFLFASLLASWPDAARRDPARALALINEVGNSFDYDPAVSEIRASALAAQGDFKAAQRAQTRAITIARKLQWDVSQMQVRLRAYESNQVAEGELIEF